jgi:hypothetical protein
MRAGLRRRDPRLGRVHRQGDGKPPAVGPAGAVPRKSTSLSGKLMIFPSNGNLLARLLDVGPTTCEKKHGAASGHGLYKRSAVSARFRQIARSIYTAMALEDSEDN